jgi:hypothetical protein
VSTPTTIADAWTQYADDVLPIDTPEVDVTRARRAFYAAMLDASRMVEAGVKPAAIRAEAIGYARTIGRSVEAART